jgi:hypothetical protein
MVNLDGISIRTRSAWEKFEKRTWQDNSSWSETIGKTIQVEVNNFRGLKTRNDHETEKKFKTDTKLQQHLVGQPGVRWVEEEPKGRYSKT